MKEIRQIKNNILQYVFIEDEDSPHMDVNITVLLDGQKAMLIDAAYSKQALLVKEDLMSKGITVDKIVLSHYHPDHANGATEFPDTILSCGVHYEDNYNNCNDVWDKEHNYRKPQEVLLDGTREEYGDFVLSFFETPGHSKCSIVTLIDEKIAHVGDLLMTDVDDNPTVPSISGGSFEEHLTSLRMLKTLGAEVLILSHGKQLVGQADILNAIDMRIHYLESVLNSNGKIDLDDALIGGSNKWSFTSIHKNNLSRL